MADVIVITVLVCLALSAGIFIIRKKGCSCSCKNCPHRKRGCK